MLSGKESTYSAGDMSLIPGSRRSPEGGNGNPLQYSCQENPRGALAGLGSLQSVGSQWDMTEHKHSQQHTQGIIRAVLPLKPVGESFLASF